MAQLGQGDSQKQKLNLSVGRGVPNMWERCTVTVETLIVTH